MAGLVSCAVRCGPRCPGGRCPDLPPPPPRPNTGSPWWATALLLSPFWALGVFFGVFA